MNMHTQARWWLAAMIAAAFAAGCSPRMASTPEPVTGEPAFEIRRVGARSGLNERIWLEHGLLWRESRDEFGGLRRSGPISMNRTRIDDLEATLSRYAAWQWQSVYENADLLGGESMHLVASLSGRVISTSMNNRGPAFAEDGELTYSNIGLGLGEDLLRDLRAWFQRQPM